MGMCREVGTPTEVKIRREVLRKSVMIMRGIDNMINGSRREVFRLKTSDRDSMFWPPGRKVICDLSQLSLMPFV